MAQIVDAARPANSTKNCATTTLGGAMDRGFVVNQSAVDTHVDFVVSSGQEIGVDNTADAAAPLLDMSSFWLDKTPGTDR